MLIVLLGLGVAWALAAWASARSAQPGPWFALAAVAHVVAAWWRPAMPLVLLGWLLCGLTIPTGRLGSRPRRVLAATATVGAVAAVAQAVQSARTGQPSGLASAGGVVLLALGVAAAVAVAAGARCRSAGRPGRWTLQWLAASLVLTAALDAVLVALHSLVQAPQSLAPWLVATLVLVPAGQAIAAWPPARRAADVVLVEAVVVAGLALFVVVVYLVVVIGLGHVPVGAERAVLVSSLAAAIVVAVLALPVRQRLAVMATTLAGGQPASSEQIVATLSARMTRAVPMDEVLLQIAESLHATVAEAGAEVWVGQGGVLARTVAVPLRPPARLELGVRERVVVARARIGGRRWASVWLPTIAAQEDQPSHLRVAPISHLGELLGLIVVRRPSGAAEYGADDERLLVELARQLGLALHNVRLDSALQASLDELRRRNGELQASRRRIVTASDESRRAIERNLHDGAQQYLVALAVKLSLAEQLAEDDPTLLAGLLAELRGDVQATIREVRELAHGIYPPLLRDRGLGEALRTAVRRSPLPCTLEIELPGRHQEDVETAVYFCCLEALQNAGKHAGEAAQVTVRVGCDDRQIWFEVLDDGAGFASSADGADDASGLVGHGFLNMRDRLGAIGGQLSVQSSPGRGTTVRGSIPAVALGTPPDDRAHTDQPGRLASTVRP